MIEQAKLLRVLQLIRLLRGARGRTLDQLAQALDCSTRTVRRYLDLLEEVGYLVDERTDRRGHYFLFEAVADQAPYFSPEESVLLQQALAGLEAGNPLGASLRQKLRRTTELIPLADELLDLQRGRVVRQLSEAVRARRQVRLVRYQSADSGTVRDRIVEPLALTEGFEQLNAVEVSSGRLRTYKVRRIEDVELLEAACAHATADEHLDLFGLTGPTWLPVELRLSERAYRLLVEEYRDARLFAGPASDGGELGYVFRGEVRSYLGIGRFVLGLPTEVQVMWPDALREFLREKVARARW